MPNEAAELPRTMPALWGYVTKVYAKMEDLAEVDELVEGEPATGLVYTGHLTQLFQEMSIPNPYYTHVTRALKAMECIAQLRRGGGTSMSKWALLGPPSEEVFLKADLGNTGPQKGKTNVLEQRIRDLQKRLQILEDIVLNNKRVA